MIDRATVDKILDAAKIVDVVGEFVTLHKSGDYFRKILKNDPDGLAIGKQYFRSRGIRDYIIEKFQSATAHPPSGQGLSPRHRRTAAEGHPAAAATGQQRYGADHELLKDHKETKELRDMLAKQLGNDLMV